MTTSREFSISNLEHSLISIEHTLERGEMNPARVAELAGHISSALKAGVMDDALSAAYENMQIRRPIGQPMFILAAHGSVLTSLEKAHLDRLGVLKTISEYRDDHSPDAIGRRVSLAKHLRSTEAERYGIPQTKKDRIVSAGRSVLNFFGLARDPNEPTAGL